MHYKNGREAKNGDKVIFLPNQYRKTAIAGILYDAMPGNDMCNGHIAITSFNDPTPDLREVLHADDVAAATIPDSSVFQQGIDFAGNKSKTNEPTTTA